jgi:hypothetical protein
MEILLIAVILSGAVSFWANSWGRNWFVWLFLALMISPLLASVALMIAGKTIEQRAKEEREIREYYGCK